MRTKKICNGTLEDDHAICWACLRLLLCSLSSPANCYEPIVTTSDFAEVSMQSCLMGAPQLAEWMKQHPAERLAAWRRVIGRMVGEFKVQSSFPQEFAARAIGADFSMQVDLSLP
jgi:hypothetical protein